MPSATHPVHFGGVGRNHVFDRLQPVRPRSRPSSGTHTVQTSLYSCAAGVTKSSGLGKQHIREGRGEAAHQAGRLLRTFHQGRHGPNEPKRHFFVCCHFRLRNDQAIECAARTQGQGQMVTS